MARGFKINRGAIDRFTKALSDEIQDSARQNMKPIGIEVEPPEGGWLPQTINHIYGDVHGRQVAIGNSGSVNQTYNEQPVNGELLAAAAAAVLQSLDLYEKRLQDGMRSTSVALLEELQAEAPDENRLRRLGHQLLGWLHDASAGAAGGAVAAILQMAIGSSIGAGPEGFGGVGGF